METKQLRMNWDGRSVLHTKLEKADAVIWEHLFAEVQKVSNSELVQASMIVNDDGFGKLNLSFSVDLQNSNISLWALKKHLDTLCFSVGAT